MPVERCRFKGLSNHGCTVFMRTPFISMKQMLRKKKTDLQVITLPRCVLLSHVGMWLTSQGQSFPIMGNGS